MVYLAWFVIYIFYPVFLLFVGFGLIIAAFSESGRKFDPAVFFTGVGVLLLFVFFIKHPIYIETTDYETETVAILPENGLEDAKLNGFQVIVEEDGDLRIKCDDGNARKLVSMKNVYFDVELENAYKLEKQEVKCLMSNQHKIPIISNLFSSRITYETECHLPENIVLLKRP